MSEKCVVFEPGCSRTSRPPRRAPPPNKSPRRSQRPPAIVLPKAPKLGQFLPKKPSTARREVEKDFVEPRTHPLTPHVTQLPDIMPLIARYEQFMDYRIISVTTMHPHPPVEIVQRKTEMLLKVLKLVQDPVQRHFLSVDTYYKMFDMLKKHIFHPLPAFQPPNIYSEIISNFYVTNWEHVDICHTILQSMLCDSDVFATLIDNEFTENLIRQLDTPVQIEKNQVENDLHVIIEHYVGYRNHILHCMLSKVISYLDSFKAYTASMGPILRLFLNYFMTLKPPLKQNTILLFKTVFYPLYSSEYAGLFETSLQDLSAFFQLQDPGTSVWCLNYLKQHWPRASSQKQMLFLRQLECLMQFLPDVMEKITEPLVKILSQCIISENVNISMTATTICNSPDFLNLIKPTPDFITNYLIPFTKRAVDHWNEDQREYAQSLLKNLSDLEFTTKPTTRTYSSHRKRGTKLSWTDIVKEASSNDKLIIENEELQRINLFNQKFPTRFALSS